MKKFLERQVVFNFTLRILAFLSMRPLFKGLTKWVTTRAAKLNLFLNKPKAATNIHELAYTWQQLMPPDGQDHFKIKEITEDIAYTEIHLHCPLRGTGDVEACYKLMNYDRKLMEKVGGELIVLESQSNSGKPYCRLAIQVKGQANKDLIPAHLKEKKQN